MRHRLLPVSLAACAMLAAAMPALAADLEETVAAHMVAHAVLAAHLVAVAERAGMQPDEIKAILKDIADRTVIEEFWITDERGRAYLTNSEVDFTFDPDPAVQPQASAFWPLLTGEATVVVQSGLVREIDDQVFHYAAVAGIDHPRIVQVGIPAEGQ
jgi:hypothetical protein